MAKKSKRKKRNRSGSNQAQNGAQASGADRKKKVEAIRKKLKVGRIKKMDKHPELADSVSGQLEKAFTINSGKSKMLVFKDDQGIKLNIQKIENGKENEIGDTIRAVFEKMAKELGTAPVAQITTSLENLSNLDSIQRELNSLQSDDLIKGVKQINKSREIERFLDARVLPPADQRDPTESTITHIKNYLEKESGNRTNDQSYKEVLSLLDKAIWEDKALENNPDKIKSDITKLFAIRNDISKRLKSTESTSRSKIIKEKQDVALKNMLVLLDHHMMSKTWATGVMTINDQKMVASAKDMDAIKDKIETMKEKGIELTPNQAWAVVAAEKKAQTEEAKYKTATAARLEEVNQLWQTDYNMKDIDTLKVYMQQLKVATNYFLGRPPGANTNSKVNQDENLGDLLLKSISFKNVWQTNASQAAVDPVQRGSIEEQMGYAQTLDRADGEFQNRYDGTGRFNVKNPAELPKYAALISPNQTAGVADRYGESVITWKKDAVTDRMTHTPGDSWNTIGQGVNRYTSLKSPYAIFAHTEREFLRFLLAEATRKDQEWYQNKIKKGADFGGHYIETQIHGDLKWSHVEKIVVGYDIAKGTDENWAKGYIQKLESFKKENDFNFKVALKDPSGKITPAAAISQESNEASNTKSTSQTSVKPVLT